MASETYIIGGNIVPAHSEPYIVSLQVRRQHFCGGTIISATNALTAAHCYYSPSSVMAVAGAHNIFEFETAQQRVKLMSFIKHAQYNTDTKVNDIAVVLFEEELRLNDYVKPLCPPRTQTGEWMQETDLLRVCGWGNTVYMGSDYPSELHCVDVHYISRVRCNGKDHYNGVVMEGMFCAGELNVGGKDACQGDSGGPVRFNETVVGVTSWGYGCAFPNYPGKIRELTGY